MLILALLGACNVETPDQPEVDAPADAADAAEFAAGHWQVVLGLHDDDYVIPSITWFRGKCLTWTWLPEPHDCTAGMFFSGEAWTGERIEMILAPTIEQSSMAHELLHWALQRRDGDCDDGHHGPEWRELLPAAEIALCKYEGVECTVDVSKEF